MTEAPPEGLLDSDEDKMLLHAQRAATRGDWAAVLAGADEVLKNEPDRAEAMFLAAVAIKKTGNEGIAAQLFRLCAKKHPNRAPIWYNLASCLHERHPQEAYRALIRANAISPDDHDTLSSLSNVASQMGRHAEAIEWADRCLRLYGAAPDAAHNKSFALFALGRWDEAWRCFRSSLGQPARKIRNYHANRETPRWDPSKDEKAVAVIYGEQGIGDEILYASMIPMAIKAAKARGSRIIIECDDRNAGLFRRSFDCDVAGTRGESYCDWPRSEGVTHKLEMGGLGEFFAPRPFVKAGYLKPDPVRRRMYGVYLDNTAKRVASKKVGIAWTGGTWATGRKRRSIPFEDILALMRGQTDCEFVCLEYEDRREALEFAPDMLNPHWATRKGADYDDLAALVSSLDLVISVQTSVVDLAGALGKPCWALTDTQPQWRYAPFLGEDRMFIYSSARAYRQKTEGDWKSVIQRVSQDLRAWSAVEATA